MEERLSDTDPVDVVVASTETAQDALAAAESALQALSDLPSSLSNIQFIGTVSHELRTPMASILGYTQLLQEELGEELEPHHQEFFQTILLNIELSLEIVSDLLDFARLDAGQLALRLAPVALQPLINQVIDQLHPFAREKGISLSADLHEEGMYIEADEIRLRQVLINIITNAIKYTDEGSVIVRVVPTGERSPRTYVIEIVDTGQGIQADFIPNMFERYTREERLAHLVQQGAGIGLAISLEYVHAMEGEVKIDSSPGIGTTFRLQFPETLLDFFTDDPPL